MEEPAMAAKRCREHVPPALPSLAQVCKRAACATEIAKKWPARGGPRGPGRGGGRERTPAPTIGGGLRPRTKVRHGSKPAMSRSEAIEARKAEERQPQQQAVAGPHPSLGQVFPDLIPSE